MTGGFSGTAAGAAASQAQRTGLPGEQQARACEHTRGFGGLSHTDTTTPARVNSSAAETDSGGTPSNFAAACLYAWICGV